MTAAVAVDSVVEVAPEGEARWWASEKGAILAALGAHYGQDFPGAALPESADPVGLRALLRASAPRLAAVAGRIRRVFDDGACAVLLPRLGVTGIDADEQRKALFALAALLGDVMANHPQQSVVWDVHNRGRDTTRRVKASDTDRGAGYHTDAGYLRVPPRFFLLYAAHAASCGGGATFIRDARVLRRQLEATERGRAAIRVLSSKVPRRVARELFPVADVAEDGFQYAPVLDGPMWRWSATRTRPVPKGWDFTPGGAVVLPVDSRHGARRAFETVTELLTTALAAHPEHATAHDRAAIDTVSELLATILAGRPEYATPAIRAAIDTIANLLKVILGAHPELATSANRAAIDTVSDVLTKVLAADPEYATPELGAAIDTVCELLAAGADEFRQMLPTDALLVVDNHIALHGRTAFTDQRRRLLRIRFHDPVPR
jgi:alpha-ketoglutarate-dependent taurine dioxygenase